MQAVKSSLIERAAEGKLSGAQSRLLRLQAMRSPDLLAEIEAAHNRLHASATPAASKSILLFSHRSDRLIAAAAAVLILAASATALLYPSWHRGSTPATTAQSTPPAHPLLPPVPPANKLITAAHPASRAAVFFLAAAHLRGSDETLPTLQLPKPPTSLEIQVETHRQAPKSVTLTQGTTVIATQSHPILHTAGPISYLSLSIDPAKLLPGQCLIEITPENGPTDSRPFLIHQAR